MSKKLPDIRLQPVGFIRSSIKKPFLMVGNTDIELQGGLNSVKTSIRNSQRAISEIIINDAITDILDGIEGYSHLVVLYWAHKVPEQGRRLTRVHPMGRKDIAATGIFCTCSPARPNPVLMTVVRLCGKKKNVLRVKDLDAVDGSPVIDIKPYVKEFYPQKEVFVPEWMRKLCLEISDYE